MAIHSLGFIGFGTLAKILYDGLKDELANNKISLLVNSRSNGNAYNDTITYVSKETLLQHSDIIILAIKPQQLPAVMPALCTIDWQDKCLVSLLAGVPLASYSKAIKSLSHAFRIMPNTSAQFHQSMTTFSSLPTTNNTYEDFLISLFSTIGSILKVNESMLDFCTALCGSGPAFLYQLFQSMLELAEQEGISPENARLMINQLAQGVATSLMHRNDSIETLITDICSPKGTTEAGISYLHQHHIPDQWQAVFHEAKQRSIELSKASKSV
ncbi:hypothetical protein DID74_01520 [Candidatus Marinamargulisbacteria bacterium SCGC AG-333-B06]|nr:hypothetical protein DID74_01520 [Candidatus Marinamargulisbacteria bacterium SCGC AG-333-B06]